MRPTTEFETALYSVANNSSLKAAITGSIYKGERPSDSGKEDIVIGGLVSDGEMIQRAVLNINIHVPRLQNSLPNRQRINILYNLGLDTFSQGYGSTFNFWIDNHSVMKDESGTNDFINLRIRFKQHNTN